MERRLEVRLPDAHQPDVAEHEPHAQEDVERHGGHAGHGHQRVVVVEVEELVAVTPDLFAQQEQEFEDAETSAYSQVDGQLGFSGTFVEVVRTWGRENVEVLVPE